MTTTNASKFRSGKSHRDENFPVASRLIHPRHRAPILAFYNFVRTADDIADHATLEPKVKLELLDELEQGLLGTSDANPEAVALRRALSERRLSPRHAQDLLTAFRMDVTKLRYRDWDDLIDYCSLFGDAGRPLRARRARRGHQDLAGERRAVRGAANHQPHPGLQGGLPQSRPRLYPAGCFCRRRLRRDGAGPSARVTPTCELLAPPRPPHGGLIARAAIRSRP